MRATSSPENNGQSLPALNPQLRYTVNEAVSLLKISRATLYLKISGGSLRIIKDGGRTFVPGSEIIRCSTLAA